MNRTNRVVMTATAGFLLASCGGTISDRIDETTGTTLAQRCANYQLWIRFAEAEAAAGRPLIGDTARWVSIAQLAWASNCLGTTAPPTPQAAQALSAPVVPPAPEIR